MYKASRIFVSVLSAAILAACSQSQPGGEQPLAYAPANTPYAYANLEPQSKETIDWSSRQIQRVWPIVIGMYSRLLTENVGLDERDTKIVAAILDELRARDNFDKLREIGYKPDARVAIYGVGMLPVARIELSDPAAFKAMVARVEAKVGEKIPVGKTGGQEYWQFTGKDATVAVAVEGAHLVATFWPVAADDDVKQLLLGLKKPDKNLLDAGTLQAIAKKYGYSPYGEGFVDFANLIERFSSAPTGDDLVIAKSLKLPLDAPTFNSVCLAEARGLAQKVPRLVAGIETLTPRQIRLGLQIETEAALAQSLMTTLTAAPGTGAPAEGLLDISIATPVLKIKDFLLTQADAVAAKPFACAEFTELNQSFAAMKKDLATTIPPPFSDMTGLRLTLDKFERRADNQVPDFSARLLFASSNPLAAIGMAQMLTPQLKGVPIAADGKPVALPDDLVPASLQLPPIWIAMNAKGIALASGKGADATLGAYLDAAPSANPVFLRLYFSGALYGLIGQYTDVFQASLPDAQKNDFTDQASLFALYEKMIHSGEFTFEANPNGIGMHETVIPGN